MSTADILDWSSSFNLCVCKIIMAVLSHLYFYKHFVNYGEDRGRKTSSWHELKPYDLKKERCQILGGIKCPISSSPSVDSNSWLQLEESSVCVCVRSSKTCRCCSVHGSFVFVKCTFQRGADVLSGTKGFSLIFEFALGPSLGPQRIFVWCMIHVKWVITYYSQTHPDHF